MHEAQLPPRSQLGPFEIERLIGCGTTSDVYRATDRDAGRVVALKVLRRASPMGAGTSLCQHEASCLARCHHPHVATLFGAGCIDGVVYLAIELMHETLETRLQRGRLPADDACRVVRQLLLGLAAIHHRGLIHRDLKPANVGFTASGQVKLFDFGIALPAGGDAASTGTCDGPSIVGSLPYLAPELLAGQPATTRSDLYAVGALLYEACCGRPPFRHRTVAGLLDQVLHAAPQLSGDLRPDVVTTITVALAKAPEDRAPSADAMRAALRLCRPASPARPNHAPCAVRTGEPGVTL